VAQDETYRSDRWCSRDGRAAGGCWNAGQWNRVRRLHAGNQDRDRFSDQDASKVDLRAPRKRTLPIKPLAKFTVSRADIHPRLPETAPERTVRTLLGAAIGLGAARLSTPRWARVCNEGRDITAVTLGGGVAIGAAIERLRAVATRSSTRRRPQ